MDTKLTDSQGPDTFGVDDATWRTLQVAAAAKAVLDGELHRLGRLDLANSVRGFHLPDIADGDEPDDIERIEKHFGIKMFEPRHGYALAYDPGSREERLIAWAGVADYDEAIRGNPHLTGSEKERIRHARLDPSDFIRIRSMAQAMVRLAERRERLEMAGIACDAAPPASSYIVKAQHRFFLKLAGLTPEAVIDAARKAEQDIDNGYNPAPLRYSSKDSRVIIDGITKTNDLVSVAATYRYGNFRLISRLHCLDVHGAQQDAQRLLYTSQGKVSDFVTLPDVFAELLGMQVTAAHTSRNGCSLVLADDFMALDW